MVSETLDVTSFRRWKRFLNWTRYSGLVFTGFLVLGALVFPYLAVVVGLLLWASWKVWYGSVSAAVTLAVTALAGGAFFVREYLLAGERLRGLGLDPEASSAMVQANLLIAAASLAFALVFLLGLWSALRLGSAPLDLPGPDLSTRWRGLWRVRHSAPARRAFAFYTLMLASYVAVASPFLIEIGGMVVGVDVGVLDRLLVEPVWWWIVLPLLLFLLWAGNTSLIRARRLAAKAAAGDPSNPDVPEVLLLRSFEDDVTPLTRTQDQNSWTRRAHRRWWTLEQSIENILGHLGSVTAIGRPGEELPPAGAPRRYLKNEEWRDRIREHIADAKLIVVILGESEGLDFEYRTLVEVGALAKTVFVCPPLSGDEVFRRWHALAAHLPPRLAMEDTQGVGQADVAHFRKAIAIVIDEPEGRVVFVTCRWRRDEDDYLLGLSRALWRMRGSSTTRGAA